MRNLDWLFAAVVIAAYRVCLALAPAAPCGDAHPPVVFRALEAILPWSFLAAAILFAIVRKHLLAKLVCCAACLVCAVPLAIILDNVRPSGVVAVSLQDVLQRAKVAMPEGKHTYWIGEYNLPLQIGWRWAQHRHGGYEDVTYEYNGDADAQRVAVHVVTFASRAAPALLALHPDAIRVRTATRQDVLLWFQTPSPASAVELHTLSRAAHSSLRPISLGALDQGCIARSLDSPA